MKKNKKIQHNTSFLPSTLFYCVLLTVLNILAHMVWVNPEAVISNGDWMYLYPQALKTLSWGSWITLSSIESAFGSPNFLPTRFLISVVGNFVTSIGFNQQVSDMIIFYLPMLLIGSSSIFLLLNYLSKSRFSAFIGSLFYLFNGYILVWAAAGYTLVLVYFLSPFVFLSIIYFIKYITWLWGFLAILALSLVIFFELRLAILLSFFAFCYLIFLIVLKELSFKSLTSKRFLLISTTLLFLLLGVNYYLFVFSSSKSFQEAISTGITNRILIKPGYFFLQNVLTTFYPFWTTTQPTMFFMQVVPWYFWIIPPYVFAAIAFIRKEKKIIFFLLSALVLIFLGKGPTPPLDRFYEWAYYHVPIFDFFRESSKFWQLLLLTFSILIAFGIKYVFAFIDNWIHNSKVTLIFKALVTFPLLVIIFITAKPAFTGEMGPGYISYKIPQEYIHLKNFLLAQKTFSRVLQVPTFSRFVFFNDIHPRLAHTQLQNFQSLSPYILRLLTVQYLVVPTDPYFEVYPGNSSYETYKDVVGKNVKPFKVFNSLMLYKNPLPSVPHIYASASFNSIKGKFTSIDRVFGHFVDKQQDFYLHEDIQNKSTNMRFLQDKQIQELTVLSCATCAEFVASDTATFDSFTAEETQYTIEVDTYGISQASVHFGDNEFLWTEMEGEFSQQLILQKQKYPIKVDFVRKNLAANPEREYVLQKKNEEIVVAENNLQQNTSYKVSFEYAIPKETNHTLILRQNTDFYFQYQQGKPGGPEWHAYNGPLLNDGKWHTAEMTFTTLVHPQKVTFNFLSEKENANIKVRNISLITNRKPEIFLSRNFPSTKQRVLPTLIFHQINPTKYTVQVHAAKQPFILVFAEQYNTYWQAAFKPLNKRFQQNDAIKVSNNVFEIPAENTLGITTLLFGSDKNEILSNHFKLNGYANAWYVDKKGTYEIELTFLPQKEFVMSLLTSLVFFGTCIIILCVLVYANYRSKKK